MSALHELQPGPTDFLSTVRFSPSGKTLAVGSWDCNIYIFNQSEDASQPFTFIRQLNCERPVLDLAWGQDDSTIFHVGLDFTVMKFDMNSGTNEILSVHGDSTSRVVYSTTENLVISSSWNNEMHVHDPGSGQWISVRLPAKAYALATTADKLVVAMAERKVNVYTLTDLRQAVSQVENKPGVNVDREIAPWQIRESCLKYMPRAVSCTPDGTRFATSSIEGRVGVEWFDPERQKDSYAFKCHRQTRHITDENGEQTDFEMVYQVDALAFNPIHGTFATGGGDGVVVFWDPQAMRRIKLYKELEAAIMSLDFSPDGKFLAIGIGPGFEGREENDEDDEEYPPDQKLLKIYVRTLGENEAKAKESRKAL